MFANLLFIVVGLVICFGGIHFKRITSAFFGLAIGAGLGFLLVMVLSLSDMDSGEGLGVFFAILLAGGLTYLAWKFYKVFAIIGAIISSFAITLAMFFALFSGIGGIAVLIALLISAFFGWLSFRYFDYSFMITTAAVGGLIFSIGFIGLITFTDMDEMMMYITYGELLHSDGIVALTLVMTVVGFIVQKRRLDGQPMNFMTGLTQKLKGFVLGGTFGAFFDKVKDTFVSLKQQASGSLANFTRKSGGTNPNTMNRASASVANRSAPSGNRQTGNANSGYTQTRTLPTKDANGRRIMYKKCPICGEILNVDAPMCAYCGVMFRKRT